MNFNYPETLEKSHVDILHGQEVADPYRWLEDNNSPEVQAWIKKQNHLTQSHISKLTVRDKIRKRLLTLFQFETIETPHICGNALFFMFRNSEDNLPSLYVQPHKQDPKILIDTNKLSKTGTTVIREFHPSHDGMFLAYTLSENANDQASLYVMNIETGEKLKDEIPAKLYPAAHTPIEWHLDNTGFWYTRCPENVPLGEEKQHQKIYFHTLGSSWTEDKIIFGNEIHKKDIPGMQLSPDGKKLLISVYVSSTGKDQVDIYLLDLKKNILKPLLQSIPDAIFIPKWASHETIFIYTNYKTPNWKIVATTPNQKEPGMEEWKTIIPEGQHPIEKWDITAKALIIETIENVCSKLKHFSLEGEFIREIPLPTLGTISDIRGNISSTHIYFGFMSFLMPHSIYVYDTISQNLEPFRKIESGINPNNFESYQVWFTSKDGTQIPMFLIHKKGIKKNAHNPVLLYGYGGFNISLTPSFSKNFIPFLEAGGIWAEANLRGGGEFGENWHKAGTLKNKQNVFNDFIAAAEWLIKNNYTTQSKLAIMGGSNGGLLTGAVTIQRPDLFKAVMCRVPVLDMLRYHKFNGGYHWIHDYGNPDDPDIFHYLLNYSPYHNIKQGEKYPAMMIATGDHDDRVHPMHAYKFTARIQKATAAKNPIFLRVQEQAGHAGAVSVNRLIEEQSDIWAFLFDQLGMG